MAGMIHLEGMKSLEKIPWQYIQPGQIILAGVSVNGGLPVELADYPVLTPSLIGDLHRKYMFFNQKTVLVAVASAAYGAKLGEEFRRAKEKVEFFNECRRQFAGEKKRLGEKHGIFLENGEPISQSAACEQGYLKLDRYNSFDMVIPPGEEGGAIPSMFHHLDMTASFADVLSKQLMSKFHIPEDQPVMLHIGVDYSFSMSGEKSTYVVSAINQMCTTIQKLFQNTEVLVYAFSNDCSKVALPISGKELEKKDTYYDAFFKKVLSNRRSDIHNKVILVSDGVPTDLSATYQRAETLRRLKIDYTQIIFSYGDADRFVVESSDDAPVIDGYYAGECPVESKEMSDEVFAQYKTDRYHEYSRIAEIAHGNQIIANVHEYLGLLSIESYDRYIGALSLQN